MKLMKHLTHLLSLVGLIAITTGCELFGVDPAPPNKIEGAIFTTITNYINVPVWQTNVVTTTNVVETFATNEVGQIVTVTNIVVTPKYELVWATNTIPQYEHTVSARTEGIVQTGVGIINTLFPNIGVAAGYGILALLGGWAQLRSSKRGKAVTALAKTGEALTQEIETMLEFNKALPNGEANAEAISAWLRQHQDEQGVTGQVITMLEKRSSGGAKVAVSEIRKILGALKSVAQ